MLENEKKQQSVLNGAMILMGAVLLVKVIGVLFKMPLSNMIGAVGRGYFNSAYEVYTPIFAISMAGLPVAVSRMVAENVALGRYREARMVFRVSVRIFIIVGTAGSAILLLIAYPYARFIADIRNLPALLCIAPSIFFCCYMSSYRGYYEGLRNMTPTAISQVIEALGKLCAGLLFAKLIISRGMAQYNAGLADFDKAAAKVGDTVATVFGKTIEYVKDPAELESLVNSAIAPWAAAGAVLGVTLGSVASTVFLIICFKMKGDGFTHVQLVNSPRPREGSAIARSMVGIAVPMVISALILNITNLIDTATIQARIAVALESNFDMVTSMKFNSAAITSAVANSRLNIKDSAEVVKYLWGAYGTALDFKSLVPTMTIQLGVSALPALAAAWAVKDKSSSKGTIETVLRVSMMIALPAGIGMACLATPILNIIYGRGNSSDAISIVAPIMASYGFSTFIIAISTPVTNMLQAIGRTDIPVKSVIVAAVVKIACNFTLVGNPKFNIYGAVIGTILFYVVIVGINLFSLLRISGIRPNWKSVFAKPFICAVFSGVTAYASYGLMSKIIPAKNTASILNAGTIETMVAIGLAVVVYAISILLIKGIAREDISVIPKGEKIAKVLEKYGLLG